MRIIKEGSEQIKGIIGKKSLSVDVSYRLSGFCFLCSRDDVYLVKLMLTAEVISLTADEYSFLKDLKGVSLDERIDRTRSKEIHSGRDI